HRARRQRYPGVADDATDRAGDELRRARARSRGQRAFLFERECHRGTDVRHCIPGFREGRAGAAVTGRHAQAPGSPAAPRAQYVGMDQGPTVHPAQLARRPELARDLDYAERPRRDGSDRPLSPAPQPRSTPPDQALTQRADTRRSASCAIPCTPVIWSTQRGGNATSPYRAPSRAPATAALVSVSPPAWARYMSASSSERSCVANQNAISTQCTT